MFRVFRNLIFPHGMTKEQAREYIDRWRLVSEHIKREIRETHPVEIETNGGNFRCVRTRNEASIIDDEQASENDGVLRRSMPNKVTFSILLLTPWNRSIGCKTAISHTRSLAAWRYLS
ncbi:MAG: hypothetical protein IPL01_24300 [Acidobacteria bacterium]|nr:hypothetical protein [Acidobacteriota bacterium]